MAVGTIKLFDKAKRCGCVQDEGNRRVYFFHHCARLRPPQGGSCRILRAGECERWFGSIRDSSARHRVIRNHLAHANNYAASPEAAVNSCQTIRLVDKWSRRFTRLLDN
jgi:hypothetical protein